MGRGVLTLTIAFVATTAAPAHAQTLPGSPFVEFTGIPGISNIPDFENTRVMQAEYVTGPAYETVIYGRVPDVRYWSLAALDGGGAEIANLSDVDITPAPDGSYEVVVRDACGDTPNCLPVAGARAPLPAGKIFYRLYVPQGDECGGVSVPEVAYRPIGSTGRPSLGDPREDCPLRPGGGLDRALLASTPLTGPVPAVTAADPQPRRYDGVAGGQFDNLGPLLPEPLFGLVTDARKAAGGGATNDNAYLTTNFVMSNGNVLVRAKAPTYRAQLPDPANGLGRSDGSEQVRYWSLCTSQATRTVDCIRDEQVVVGSDGYFQVLVAPDCPVAGYPNCLVAGTLAGAGQAAVDVLVYRNQLARPDFWNDEGPKVCPGPESQFCGEYALKARYVPRPTPPPEGGGDPGPGPDPEPGSVDGRIDDWSAFSTWVGGQTSYKDGELVYQDYVYDDEGAAGQPTSDNTNGSKQFGALSQPTGTFRYPTNPARFGANAADLLQLRVKRTDDRLRVLVRLNTLLEPDTTVAAIAFGTDGSPRRSWTRKAGIATPSDSLLTLWGGGGELTDLATGESVPVESAVSTADNAIEAELPLAALPQSERLTLYAATGLWNPVVSEWQAVAGGRRTATEPGGALGSHALVPSPRLWNVAFRPDEIAHFPERRQNWFEDEQANALANGNIDEFAQVLDLGKLASGADDVPAIPRGRVVEVIDTTSSTVAGGEGVSEAGIAGRGAGQVQATAYHFLGRHQPYALYVPQSLSDGPAPLELLLHGGSANHQSVLNQDGAQRDLAERSGRILLSPLGRGPAGQFTDPAEVDTLEALEDVRERFDVDPDRIYASGYSMGGYGTYRFLALHPDLFGAAVIWAGNPGDPGQANGYPVDLLENSRNVPAYVLHGVEDPLVPYTKPKAATDRLAALGYEYRFDTHPVAEHLTFAELDVWDREDAWMSGHERNPHPRRVTWKRDPAFDAPEYGLVHDGAWWVDDVATRGAGTGLVEATSLALRGADGEGAAFGPEPGSGYVLPFVSTGRLAPPTVGSEGRNAIRLELENVDSLTVDLSGASLDPDQPVDVELVSDGPADVNFRP